MCRTQVSASNRLDPRHCCETRRLTDADRDCVATAMTADQKKRPRLSEVFLVSLSDLRGISEGDREEQRGDRKGEDEDVSEAVHRKTPK